METQSQVVLILKTLDYPFGRRHAGSLGKDGERWVMGGEGTGQLPSLDLADVALQIRKCW